MSNIVLTGASAGIGAAAAVELTRQGHRVLATGRSATKLDAVHAKMRAVAPQADVPEPIAADLASMAEVRRLAAETLDRFDTIDVLVNNAGLSARRRDVSPDGFELTMAVNHLAPFLLTNLAVERLKQSDGRVVTTSSGVHRMGRLDLDDLNMTQDWKPLRAYGTSKQANILFTSELHKRTDLPATCFHPGGVRTDLSRDAPMMQTMQRFLGWMMRSPEQGADTLVWLATSEEGANPTALYYADRKPARTAASAVDPNAAARLWDESARMVGLS